MVLLFAGFIGQMQGSVSEAVAKMAVHIPASIIAQQSGLMSLSNKQIYPTFMRTHPSSAIFAKVRNLTFSDDLM